MVNMNEAIRKIRSVGPQSVRAVPMPDQPVDGDYQIEINNGGWEPIVTGVKKQMAEDIIRQATNRVLLG